MWNHSFTPLLSMYSTPSSQLAPILNPDSSYYSTTKKNDDSSLTKLSPSNNHISTVATNATLSHPLAHTNNFNPINTDRNINLNRRTGQDYADSKNLISFGNTGSSVSGDRFYDQGNTGRAASTATTTKTATGWTPLDPANTNPELGGQRVIVHEVRPTDTIAGLSILYAINVSDLQRSNNLWASDSLQSRSRVYIPVRYCRVTDLYLRLVSSNSVIDIPEYSGDEKTSSTLPPATLVTLPQGTPVNRVATMDRIRRSTSQENISGDGLNNPDGFLSKPNTANPSNNLHTTRSLLQQIDFEVVSAMSSLPPKNPSNPISSSSFSPVSYSYPPPPPSNTSLFSTLNPLPPPPSPLIPISTHLDPSEGEALKYQQFMAGKKGRRGKVGDWENLTASVAPHIRLNGTISPETEFNTQPLPWRKWLRRKISIIMPRTSTQRVPSSSPSSSLSYVFPSTTPMTSSNSFSSSVTHCFHQIFGCISSTGRDTCGWGCQDEHYDEREGIDESERSKLMRSQYPALSSTGLTHTALELNANLDHDGYRIEMNPI